MDSFSGPSSQHPLLACVAGVGAALDQAVGITPAGLRPEVKGEPLVELCRQIERAQGLKLALLAAGEDVATQTGARDVAAWLAPRVQADHAPTKALLHLAEAIEARWHRVGAALRGGGCSQEQAKVIVRCLDELPVAQIGAELLGRAEAHLVAEATHFTPSELRRLGDKILEVIAPDAHEDAERKKFERELAKARRHIRLSLKNNRDGTTDLFARLPDSLAARLRTYLDAHTAPRHQSAGAGGGGGGHLDPATGERLPADRARGVAFCAMLEHLDPHTLPLHGGTPTTLNVTVSLDTLRTGLGVGTLDDGSHIPAGEVRRLACTAGIIPVVLGADSEVLDLGRGRRLFTGAQKRAMAITHPTCRAEGCTVPATWCEAHHFGKPWAHGGRTDLKDGKLLCPWHHHRAHDNHYQVDQLPNGDVRFNRRR